MTMLYDKIYQDFVERVVPMSVGDVEDHNIFQAVKTDCKRFELEIGCGRGDFLAEYAPLHPDTYFVGVERHLVSLRRATEKIKRNKIENVALINADIAYLFDSYITPELFDAIHLYFPDPWPKKKHVKRRVLNDSSITKFVASLKKAGILYIRSDNKSIFDDMQQVIGNVTSLSAIEYPESLRPYKTGFEKKFESLGLTINVAAYKVI